MVEYGAPARTPVTAFTARAIAGQGCPPGNRSADAAAERYGRRPRAYQVCEVEVWTS